jgi:hypothetical protein
MTQNSSKIIKIKYQIESILEKKSIDLIWHDNHEVIFRKTKTIATTSRSLELAWKKLKTVGCSHTNMSHNKYNLCFNFTFRGGNLIWC